MPDDYGNLLGIGDFTTGLEVRFHSYLDSEHLVLACAENSSCRLHDLRAGPAWLDSLFRIEARAGGLFGIWLPGNWDQLQVLARTEAGHGTISRQQIRIDSHHTRLFPTPDAPASRNFAVDMLDGGCWFALNNATREGVFDVAYGRAEAGADVQLYPWNGGNNQRWRAQITKY